MWGTIIDTANELMRTTTHTDFHNITNPLTRQLKTWHSPFRHQNLQVRESTDKMLSIVKSVWGNKYCKIFVTNFGDVKVSNKLGKMWGTIIDTANELMRTTTHTDFHNITNPLTRQLKTWHSPFRHQNLQVRESTDKMLSIVKSVWGNKYCKIFVTNFGDVKVYLWNNKDVSELILPGM